ncbi:hypothetical protein AAMO2058_001637800, partial [Amorphochlora amoebiformis]
MGVHHSTQASEATITWESFKYPLTNSELDGDETEEESQQEEEDKHHPQQQTNHSNGSIETKQDGQIQETKEAEVSHQERRHFNNVENICTCFKIEIKQGGQEAKHGDDSHYHRNVIIEIKSGGQ